MRAKIWRVLVQILSDRKDLAEKLKPFFENLHNHSINEVQYISLLKTFSKYQNEVLYKNGIITEEKLNQVIPNNRNATQLPLSISKGNDNENKNNIEEIISEDKIEKLQVLIKERGINKMNTIITSFNEVEEMRIPIIQYCVIKKAMQCFKFLLVNGYGNPKKNMEVHNLDKTQIPRRRIIIKRYEWDCMATAIYLGELEMVAILEEKGIEKGKDSVQLEAAILSYRNEIVKEIIEKMNENEENKENNQNCLKIGIFASSKNNNIKGAEFLIRKGVNIDNQDFKSNPIQKTGLSFILQHFIIQKRSENS